VVLAPAVGALAMSISTIVVAVNAMLLREVELRPGNDDGSSLPPKENAVEPTPVTTGGPADHRGHG
jgi:hypothetical protein